ncbi:MAG TPA: DUF3105 domain-containing protein [Anaerolineales bacterium]|nr:DUF3105 domain-containing protein [Anaerolineales bacterium]
MSNLSSQRERIEARRRGAQSRSTLTWTLVIIAAVAIAGYLLWVSLRPAEGTAVPLEGETHVQEGTDPQYVSNPPTSGKHYASELAPPGFYEEADLEPYLPYPEGYAVHNLEHGYIIFWYNCDVIDEAACEQLKTDIRNFIDQSLTKKLLALPWNKTDIPLVLTSWGYMLEMPVFDAGRASAFIAANAPKAPEPNAP